MTIFIPSRFGKTDGTKNPSFRFALIFHIITINVYMDGTRRHDMEQGGTERDVSPEPSRYIRLSGTQRDENSHINAHPIRPACSC